MDNYEQLLWEYDEGRISKAQFDQRLKNLKVEAKVRYEHYEPINSAVIRDTEFCQNFPGPLTLYLYLRTLVIRSGPLKHRTYGKGALLSLISQEKIASHFGVSERTVIRWVKHLLEQGLIKKAKFNQYGVGKEFQPNLYQIGYINKNSKEEYFIDKGYF